MEQVRPAPGALSPANFQRGGGVLPHFHNAAEIIHITVGKVRLLCNGEWKHFKAGDTFLVPANVVHSVMNEDPDAPSEQISVFLPVSDNNPPNVFFKTQKVDGYVV